MIKLIKRLLRCNQRKEKSVRQVGEMPDTSKYYKIKVNKYYGLQGFEYNYGVCLEVIPTNEVIDRHIGSGGEIIPGSHLHGGGYILFHLIPKGGILISKGEYLKGVENEK